MSNYLAIATVTAAFSQLISQAIQQVPQLSASPSVITGRPKAPEPGFVGVNLYLYNIEPNAALRNQHVPTRLQDGTLIQTPQTALNLNYLLTFYGNGRQQEPERLMGSTIAAIAELPILTSELIQQTIDAAGSESYLAASNLAQQVELLRIGLNPLNLEELSKLWTVFFQVTHDLSISYQVSVILIDSTGTPVHIPEVNQPPRTTLQPQ